MSNDNERARLAKEVIARLDAGKLFAVANAYWDDKTTNQCRVCAVASLAVARCGFDALKEASRGDRYNGDEGVTSCLHDLFPERQLGLIEAAYEGDVDAPFSGRVAEDDAVESALNLCFYEGQWGERLTKLDAQARLRAIMQNIIDNNGEFRP